MLRIAKLALCASALLIIWLIALNTNFDEATHSAILWLPVLSVLAFGVYLFLWLLLGVASFKTVPEEAESLKLDVQRARRELSKRGITI